MTLSPSVAKPARRTRMLVPEQDDVMDVFLNPGDFYFGDHQTRIRTLLGSCVAITMWHPRRQIGGMCHYLMPTRPHHRRRPDDLYEYTDDLGELEDDGGERGAIHRGNVELDGRYADDAMAMFLEEIRLARTKPQEYVVKIFGGGSQFRDGTPAANSQLPDRNVETALELMEHHRLNVRAKHLGGKGHRQVVFEVWSGDVWMRHVDTQRSR